MKTEPRGTNPSSTQRKLAVAGVTLQLIMVAALSSAIPATSFAYHEGECHPNQPGCLPNGEHYLYFEKPLGYLKYHLAPRAHLWTSAWRTYQNNSKPWAKESYDPNYVYPDAFHGVFDTQCQNKTDWDYFVNGLGSASQVGRYRWTVNGVVQSDYADCFAQTLTFHSEGIHDVMLEVFAPGQSTPYLVRTEDVRVRDFLIVLFGDSAASGEGSPDHERGPNQEWGSWVDRRCHRSELAAVPLAVQELEKSDPHSTITFLNFACSGATVKLWEPGQGVGILGPYAGIEPTEAAAEYGDNDPTFYIPSQVAQLSHALHTPEINEFSIDQRKVDMLLTTGGINDVRFAKLAVVCVIEDNCEDQYSDIYGGANDVATTFDDLADQIPGAYLDLADALADEGIYSDKVFPGETPIYVMQYPDAFQDDFGNRCNSMLWDVLPSSSIWYAISDPIFGPIILFNSILSPVLEYELGVNVFSVLSAALFTGLEWDRGEIDWMVDHGMPGLDKGVRDGADLAGFKFIDGIQAAFANHGYCASDNWIRQAAESSDTQGPWNIVSKPLNPPFGHPLHNPFEDVGFGIHALTKGLMHPAPPGYVAWSKVLRPYLDELKNHAPVAKGETYNVNPAVDPVFQTNPFNGVLFNDYDPDDDEIRAVWVAGPSHGTATLSQGGHLTYEPTPGYYGFDSIYYEVTDGAAVAKAKVTLRVGNPRDPSQTWNWNFPTGEETPVAEIGGIAEFPVCNRCGDLVLRIDPEREPRFGRVVFEQTAKDRWVARYFQNGLVPEELPWEEIIHVEIGRIIERVFVREGQAEILLRIVGEAPPPAWSWTFETPEIVGRLLPTRFDVCANCADLVVRVNVDPEWGTVDLEPDAETGQWYAIYTYDPTTDFLAIGDGFGLEIGQISGELVLPLDSTRVSLSINE